MKPMVLLDYTFLFDPADTWQHLYQFEKELVDFLASKGLESEVIKAIEGQAGKRILYIKKKEVVVTTPVNPVGRPVSLKGLINNMRTKEMKAPEKNFKKGIFVKTKGYIKR